MKKSIFLTIIILTLAINQKALSQKVLKDDLQKAINLVKQGQKAEASAILTSLMESYPNNKEAVQWWLISNMKRSPTGELDALVQLDSLAVIYPQNTGILFFKTFIQAEYGKNEEALVGIEKLIKLQPDTAVNYIAKGQVMSALNRYQEAFDSFDKATSLDPKHPNI